MEDASTGWPQLNVQFDLAVRRCFLCVLLREDLLGDAAEFPPDATFSNVVDA
jgi:hypothetical protein